MNYEDDLMARAMEKQEGRYSRMWNDFASMEKGGDWPEDYNPHFMASDYPVFDDIREKGENDYEREDDVIRPPL